MPDALDTDKLPLPDTTAIDTVLGWLRSGELPESGPDVWMFGGVAGAEVERLKSAIRREAARAERMEAAARKVLAAAHVDVPIAKLSDDDLDWLCPKCRAAGSCMPGCTRNALLAALDDLAAALPAADRRASP